MKKYLTLISILMIFLFIWIYQHSLLFLYCNPYTNTSSFSEISYTIKELTKGFNYAQKSSKKTGKNYKFLFWNAYGSGFLKNNPIPNDLDFAIGIDLGEFEYNEDNKEAIAEEIVNKMQAFQYSFNFYIYSMENKLFYSPYSPLEILSKTSAEKEKFKSCIVKHFDDSLSGNNYVLYTQKTIFENDKQFTVDVPYLMQPNEILIEDYSPIILYSDIVSYNSKMPHYLREISIIPEFYITVKHKKNKVRIELVPESYIGDRLQISRKFFASNTFIGKISERFIKDLHFLKDDEEYLFYRMFSYKRHLQEVENIYDLQDRPVKLFKRIMQTADIAYPLLEKNTYEEISNFVLKNLSDLDFQLLNEYENICKTFLNITIYPKLYAELVEDGKIQEMYDKAGYILEYLEANGNIDKKSLELLQKFYMNELTHLSKLNNVKVIENYRSEILLPNYENISETLKSLFYARITNYKNIEKYINIFEKIYTDAGYHKIFVCWLDKNLAGIEKDNFTSSIADLKTFALENGLANIDYKLIDKSEVSPLKFNYTIWAKYNQTNAEKSNFNKFRNILLHDKKNFSIKKKIIF